MSIPCGSVRSGSVPELPGIWENRYLLFPEADPLALPIFTSEQSRENDIRPWAKEKRSRLCLEGSFRLACSGSMFAKEGLGSLRTRNSPIDTSSEMKTHLIWKKASKLHADGRTVYQANTYIIYGRTISRECPAFGESQSARRNKRSGPGAIPVPDPFPSSSACFVPAVRSRPAFP